MLSFSSLAILVVVMMLYVQCRSDWEESLETSLHTVQYNFLCYASTNKIKVSMQTQSMVVKSFFRAWRSDKKKKIRLNTFKIHFFFFFWRNFVSHEHWVPFEAMCDGYHLRCYLCIWIILLCSIISIPCLASIKSEDDCFLLKVACRPPFSSLVSKGPR